jgi:hypothetical protein
MLKLFAHLKITRYAWSHFVWWRKQPDGEG